MSSKRCQRKNSMSAEINYIVTTPQNVGEEYGWLAIQELQAAAFEATLPDSRKAEDISHLVNATDIWRYAETRLDPNMAIGREFGVGQRFYAPHVVIAEKEGEVVGYLYSALNISGGGLHRAVKRATAPHKIYNWQREVAVAPDHQHKGVARAMLAVGLQQRDARHPVTAYVWKDELPELYNELTTTYRMRDTGSQSSQPYGAEAGDIAMHRLQGYSREVGLAAVGRDGKQHAETKRALQTATVNL